MKEVSQLEKILSGIDKNYSKKLQMKQLKFLGQVVVPHEQLVGCPGVPEVFWKLSEKLDDYGVSTAVLRHMLQVTNCKNKGGLQALSDHCCEEFDLYAKMPSLPFYELLLLLSRSLRKNNTYCKFLNDIPEDKLDMSKHDLLSESPLDMFQSMIRKGTIVPSNPTTLLKEVATPLREVSLSIEAKLIENSVENGKL